MLDPEYYAGAFKQDGIWTTNKFTDGALPSGQSDSETVIWERKPLYFAAIPGLSEWSRLHTPTPAQDSHSGAGGF